VSRRHPIHRHPIRRLLLPALLSALFAAVTGVTGAAAAPLAPAAQAAAAAAWAPSGNVHDCGSSVHLLVPTRSSGYFAENPGKLLAAPASVAAGPGVATVLDKVASAHVHFLTALSCGQGHPGAPVTGTGGRASADSGSAGNAKGTNWSGYQSMSTGTRYLGGAMTWTVPAPQAPADSVVTSSIWTGIGSGESTSDTLVQAGTEQDNTCQLGCFLYGNVYYFFFELYPQQQQVVVDNLGLEPGDSVASVVQYDPSTQTAYFQLDNLTQKDGLNFTETLTGTDPGSGSHAEWILERTEFNSTWTAVGDFGTLNVTGAQAYAGSSLATARTYAADDPAVDPLAIDLYDCAGQQLEHTSPFTSSTAFTMTWLAYGSSDPAYSC